MEGPDPGAVTLDPQNSKEMQVLQRFSTQCRTRFLFNICISHALQIASENIEQILFCLAKNKNVEQTKYLFNNGEQTFCFVQQLYFA